MKLSIDHVTISGSRLEALASAFAAAGLASDYGGIHSNGVTHMSTVGFKGGSYVELVSIRQPGQVAPWWHQHIVRDGGPCAWAVSSDDVGAEARRLRELGISVDGPHHLSRTRPDRVTAEWDLAYVGDHGAGAMLPFVIRDCTPRKNRVRVADSVRKTELRGVEFVVLGVPDVTPAAELFQRAYGLAQPEPWASPEFPGPMLRFLDAPLVLAAPGPNGGDWLGERLDLFGPSPCAILLGSRDFDRSLERLPLDSVNAWGRRRQAWFASAPMRKLRVGVVGD